jgi:arylsulfatase A-like enzyme
VDKDANRIWFHESTLKMSRRPNLIVFLPDQERADAISYSSEGKVHSPNLTKLASESVIFSRTYVTHPVCSPSRSSLITGMWPHATGCTKNNAPLPAQFDALPELLQSKDYRTGYMGKWHLGDENTAQRGFQQWVSTEGVSDYSKFLVELGLSPDKADGSFTKLSISFLSRELSKPKFLENHAIRFIEKYRREPFLLFVAFAEPHSPYNGPFNNEHSLDEVDLDMTAIAPPSDNVPLRYRLMREWQQAEAARDRKRGDDLFFFGITPHDYRRLKQRYLGLVTLIDESIGAILGALERTELASKTIIVHTSDHGDLMGAHHLFAKEVMFEEAVHVPYLVRLPERRNRRTISQAVSHIDFVPTLIDLLGDPVPLQCSGKSRLPLIRGETMPPQNIFIEWAPNRTKIKKGTSLAPRRMIKRAVEESTRAVISPDDWKLCLRDKDLNELYNLKNDPHETRNLFYTGEYSTIIARLTDDVHRWQKLVGDRLPI